MDEQPPPPYKRSNSPVPWLATTIMPPVHDYPRATAGTSNPDYDQEYLVPPTPRGNHEVSWTEIAMALLQGLIITAMAFVLNMIWIAYGVWILKRRGYALPV